MPPLVEPKPMNSAPENSSPDTAAPLTLRDRISALRARRKVFYDSPGLLDQSHHWGGVSNLDHCCGYHRRFDLGLSRQG